MTQQMSENGRDSPPQGSERMDESIDGVYPPQGLDSVKRSSTRPQTLNRDLAPVTPKFFVACSTRDVRACLRANQKLDPAVTATDLPGTETQHTTTNIAADNPEEQPAQAKPDLARKTTAKHVLPRRQQHTKGPIQTTLDDFSEKPRPREAIPAYGPAMQNKGPNTLRIATQNPNGFHALSMTEGAECIDIMRELNLDIFGFSETNRNWDEKSRYALAQLTRRDGPGISIAASDYSEKEGYLPGGTALLLKGNQCGRVSKRYPDKLGRYCFVLMHGKGNVVIPILTLYRVCQKRGSTTTPNTSYAREINHLRLKGHKYPDPRAQLLKDIGKLLYEWTNLGYHPILMGDFNSDPNNEDLRDFMSRHGLIDLIDKNEGTPVRTYAYGRKHLDLLLGDKHVFELVQA